MRIGSDPATMGVRADDQLCTSKRTLQYRNYSPFRDEAQRQAKKASNSRLTRQLHKLTPGHTLLMARYTISPARSVTAAVTNNLRPFGLFRTPDQCLTGAGYVKSQRAHSSS